MANLHLCIYQIADKYIQHTGSSPPACHQLQEEEVRTHQPAATKEEAEVDYTSLECARSCGDEEEACCGTWLGYEALRCYVITMFLNNRRPPSIAEIKQVQFVKANSNS